MVITCLLLPILSFLGEYENFRGWTRVYLFDKHLVLHKLLDTNIDDIQTIDMIEDIC